MMLWRNKFIKSLNNIKKNIRMQTRHLTIGSVDVEVKFKPIKNLHLSVHPPYGKVTVSSPEFFDLEKVRVYLLTKLGWIKRERTKIANQEREGEKLMVTRESHQFFGKDRKSVV